MLTMATDERTRHYFQTYQWLKNQYTAWAANMRATRAYASRQGHTSNDALGNALFMWAREQDPEKLAGMLQPYLDRFQGIWDVPSATGQPWIPGAVRDQTSLDEPPRKRAHVNETKVNPDRKPGKRRGIS